MQERGGQNPVNAVNPDGWGSVRHDLVWATHPTCHAQAGLRTNKCSSLVCSANRSERMRADIGSVCVMSEVWCGLGCLVRCTHMCAHVRASRPGLGSGHKRRVVFVVGFASFGGGRALRMPFIRCGGLCRRAALAACRPPDQGCNPTAGSRRQRLCSQYGFRPTPPAAERGFPGTRPQLRLRASARHARRAPALPCQRDCRACPAGAGQPSTATHGLGRAGLLHARRLAARAAAGRAPVAGGSAALARSDELEHVGL